MSIPVVTKKTVARSKAVLVFMGIHGVIIGCLALYVNRPTMLTLALNYFALAVVLIAYLCYRQDLYDYQLDQLVLQAEKDQKRAEELAKEGEGDEP